ncbi:MAG: DUF6249 domain-containing protein [Flavobacteriaceae bacterium]
MEPLIIPLLGILSGIIIPIAVFTWLYHENKDKRKTVLEIAKHMDNPEKLDELMQIFEERKKEPIDYRRNGVITIFVGIGLYFFGFIWIGKVLEGIGFLVAAIGLGTLIAGYLYPNTEKELTNAVEKFEKR